ncbi:hypothetical protein NIES4102_25030 [Chondrocystis sp. NIES-4102]|nr:hypothetical protein NIES4102_25030 [Chondrocystis sp. NIES-4102]
MIQAQPALEFIPPAYNYCVWKITKKILPWWLNYHQDIINIKINNASELIELYSQFNAGKMRFLLAFRHPTVTDPACIVQLLWNQLPQIAKQQGKPLKSPVHAHFIYDRGIPLWAGDKIGWILSQLGGTPIRRSSVDRQGLRSIRDLYLNGVFPMAAAPEGATNGHNEIVSPLEPGIAQFSFWCQEDLQKAQRKEAVAIAPVGIRYFYQTAPWQYLEQLLSQLELESGFSTTANLSLGLINGVAPTANQEADFYQRLSALALYLLSLMEEFYGKFYQQNLSSQNQDFPSRLQALLNAALMVAEQSLNIPTSGNFSDRCRRVEQAGWNRIYRDDLSTLDTLAPAQRGLANLIASETQLRLWHMRLVENFVSVTGYYVAQKPSVERFADTILLLWKMIAQLKGESGIKTPYLGKKRVEIIATPPLMISDYWQQYQINRRGAVNKLTQDLQITLEQAISIL